MLLTLEQDQKWSGHIYKTGEKKLEYSIFYDQTW